MGQVMNSLRLVLVGGSFGPGVAAIIAVLGKQEAISRIYRALDTIGK
jgi:glutamyl-tRNA synthetase